jgi:ParB-like nuclease family protein
LTAELGSHFEISSMETPMHTGQWKHQIELWPLGRLVEYARNPRKNDAAVDRMCASIREFGFKIPCLVRSDGQVVDGHLRLNCSTCRQTSK